MKNKPTATHTPGPWKVHGTAIETSDPGPADVIAHVYDGPDAPCNGDPEANARLIAAAPAMKSGLYVAANTMESVIANIENQLKVGHQPFGGSTWSILSMLKEDAADMRAAIARAEGGK